MSPTTTSLFGAVYLLAVPAAGVAVVLAATFELVAAPPPLGWFLLTAVTALTGSYTFRIPGLFVRLSASEPTVFLATLLYGPAAGAITAAVDASIMSLRLVPQLRTPHRILFNVGTLAISVYAAGHLYFHLAGLDPRQPIYGPLETFVAPLYVFAGAVFITNSWLVSLALAIERRANPLTIWRRQFLWLSATYLASASIAAILVTFTHTLNFALVALLLPLAGVSFLAIRTTLGRLEDANKHLSEVNQLYLSTIETLAMAVDAKDQVTHGHIRRVQKLAIELAKALGVTDDRQLKAIEAAALLHDMGKLAIPEFILNKPGKLTTSEFEVMKTHAALGADILSSIRFPYPVVPIVRHHHENWDGTGYPDGVKGSDIPIGARILSVVDCYDALTSDRPYRAALSDEAAIEIIVQRRGKMYDPLVVDTFVDALRSVRQALEREPATSIAAKPEPPLLKAEPPFVHEPGAHSLDLLTAIAPFPRGPSLRTVARDAIHQLRQLTVFDSAALFTIDSNSLELRALIADGTARETLEHLTIPVAERLSGWVAAYRTAVWNSDAALDLEISGRPDGITLATAVPLAVEDELVGVLTLYGRHDQQISASDRRNIEQLALPLSVAIAEAKQRSPQSIDGSNAIVRSAALAILDAALSHESQPDCARQETCFVALPSEAITRTSQTPTRAPIAAMARHVLSDSDGRYCIVLSERSCIFYQRATAGTKSPLYDTVRTACSRHLLNSAAVSVTVLKTPLDLQAVIRGVDSASTDTVRSTTQRVH